MYVNRYRALILIFILAPRREALTHNLHTKQLSRDGHDFAEQRLEVNARALDGRFTESATIDDIGSGERRVNR